MKLFFKCVEWLVGFITVAAILVCVLATWNSRKEWEKYKAQLTAHGEHLDTDYYIPLPVPDEKNFAKAPLLKPLFDYNIDPATNEITYPPPGPAIRNIRMDIPGANVPLPGLAGWKTGHAKDLQAWQDYYRAALPGMPHSAQPAEDVLAVLDRFDPMLSELRAEAAARPFSRFPLKYDLGIAMPIPHVTILQNLQIVLAYRAIAGLDAGHTDEAFADVQLGFRLVDTIYNEPTLISQLVRVTMLDILIQPVWEGIAAHRWSDDQLEKMETAFQQLDFPSDFNHCMQWERAVGNWTFEKIRNDPEWTNTAFDTLHVTATTRFALLRMTWTGLWYKNQTFLNRTMQENTLRIFDTEKQTVDVARAKATEALIRDLPFSNSTFMAKVIMSVYGDVPRHIALAQTNVNEAIVACEIERYRLAHGALPATLGDLHMPDLPHDIINGQPLHYSVNGDDYLLYSVGWNEVDDGGKVVLKPNSTTPDPDQGDWVWSLKPL